ncbi:lipocalin family protein [Pigmentiphaga litoralis]|uniref:lipocalin family protein n=1 Tax=Pigmentiphaga litoralis TaxID=516702 RepID=UPI001676A968|nr:lipocalin family protein [Pigmentiphaga litoralis]
MMVRRLVAGTCVALAVAAASVAAFAAAPPVTSVPQLDIVNYMGQWYEISKYPNRFQKDCRRNTTATYRAWPEGGIEVINRCEQENGKVEEAVGRARPGKTASQLEVRFAPSWLSFLAWVWAPYWVIQLAPDYRYAVVSEPDREYLWILARSPTLSPEDQRDIMSKLADQGYDTSKLQRTEQTGNPTQK